MSSPRGHSWRDLAGPGMDQALDCDVIEEPSHVSPHERTNGIYYRLANYSFIK